MDSPSGLVFIGISLLHILAFMSTHIPPLQGSRVARVLVPGSLLILPLVTIACLYVAGLPEA